jgi:hypothetical protein
MYHVCFTVSKRENGISYYVEVYMHGKALLEEPADVVLLDGYPPALKQDGFMCTTADTFFFTTMTADELRLWFRDEKQAREVLRQNKERYRVLYAWLPEMVCNCGGY